MKRFVVFASGKGSNCIKIYERLVVAGKSASLGKIIVDNSKAGILEWADNHQIPTALIKPRDFKTDEDFGQALIKSVGNETDLIVLAGYLKKIPDNFLKRFHHRIVNIHPALLPSFGGTGMYGMNVHRAVFSAGMKVSGITIHLIDEFYDHGPVVFQATVEIDDCKSPEEIANKVLQFEHRHYGEIIEKLLFHPYQVIDGKFFWREIT